LGVRFLRIHMKNEINFQLLLEALQQASSAIPEDAPEGSDIKLRLEYAKFRSAMANLHLKAHKLQEKFERKKSSLGNPT